MNNFCFCYCPPLSLQSRPASTHSNLWPLTSVGPGTMFLWPGGTSWWPTTSITTHVWVLSRHQCRTVCVCVCVCVCVSALVVLVPRVLCNREWVELNRTLLCVSHAFRTSHVSKRGCYWDETSIWAHLHIRCGCQSFVCPWAVVRSCHSVCHCIL